MAGSAKLHVQYELMQTGFHNDLAAVMKLETASVSKKSTKAERIPMYANHRNAVVAERIIYRAKRGGPAREKCIIHGDKASRLVPLTDPFMAEARWRFLEQDKSTVRGREWAM